MKVTRNNEEVVVCEAGIVVLTSSIGCNSMYPLQKVSVKTVFCLESQLCNLAA